MVDRSFLLPVAQVVKSYDITGDVVIKITSAVFEDYKIKEPVFIFFDGLPVPFFIDSITRRGNNGAILKLDTINDYNHAEEILKKQIFIDSSKLSKKARKKGLVETGPSELIGFTLFDSNDKELGLISNFMDYPNNPCLELIPNNKSEAILIPLHQDLILDFDVSAKRITMAIPNGLL